MANHARSWWYNRAPIDILLMDGCSSGFISLPVVGTYLMVCQSTVCVRGDLLSGVKERLRHSGWEHWEGQTHTHKCIHVSVRTSFSIYHLEKKRGGYKRCCVFARSERTFYSVLNSGTVFLVAMTKAHSRRESTLLARCVCVWMWTCGGRVKLLEHLCPPSYVLRSLWRTQRHGLAKKKKKRIESCSEP